jgi:hypothetical protein
VSDGEHPLSRAQAVRALQDGHRRIHDLLARLPRAALSRPSLGGGDWSPQDLVGHLESWEEYALSALDAWDQGLRPAIDTELSSKGIDGVNREAVERKRARSATEMMREADATHRALIQRLGSLSDERWGSPGTAGASESVAERLGGILGGPTGAFRHADAHLKDLRAFVAERER